MQEKSSLSKIEQMVIRGKKGYGTSGGVLTAYCVFGWGFKSGDRWSKETEVWIEKPAGIDQLDHSDVDLVLQELRKALLAAIKAKPGT